MLNAPNVPTFSKFAKKPTYPSAPLKANLVKVRVRGLAVHFSGSARATAIKREIFAYVVVALVVTATLCLP